MKWLIVRLGINAAALWVAARVVDGIHLSTAPLDIIVVAAVFGLVNSFIKPVIVLLSLPALLVTLGLFTFIINAAMLGLLALLVAGFAVDTFFAALVGSVVVSLVSFALNVILKD